MKKLIAVLLIACTLFGCGTKKADVKTGSFKSEADADGNYTTCEVTLTDGVITSVSFDMYYAAAGKTKKELGEDYGMRKASPIGKEWFEQCEALEQWCTGKTVADATGKMADDADLKTGCTVHTGDFAAALEGAAAAAK